MNTAVTVFYAIPKFPLSKWCVRTASVSGATFLMVVVQLVCVCLEHITCKIMDLSRRDEKVFIGFPVVIDINITHNNPSRYYT